MATDTLPSAKQTKPRRRWLQYSLRTLLIVMTLLAVWLAFYTSRARRQARAAKALEEAGAEVLYFNRFQHSANAARFTKPVAPDWLRDLLSVDFVDSVRTVVLTGNHPNVPRSEPVSDAHLAHLKDLPEVEALILVSRSGSVTNAGLAHVAKLSQLKELMLANPSITDEGIGQLGALHELRFLQLATSITDAGIEQLQAFRKLERLELAGPGGFTRNSRLAINVLESSAPLNFFDVPLSDVLDFVSDLGALPVTIDQEALDEAGLDLDSPVTFTSKGPLADSLDRVLHHLDLGWMITPDGLVITTKEIADEKQAAINRLKQALPNLKAAYLVVE
ncbi:MAG: hypothetical protein ACOY3P_15380 [Planctomycetota bacterium]